MYYTTDCELKYSFHKLYITTLYLHNMLKMSTLNKNGVFKIS